jgi:hypothetical protein
LDGVAASIKSVDIDARTYNDASRLLSKLKSDVNKLINFNGASGPGVKVAAEDVTKSLKVAIKLNGTSISQWAPIAKAWLYASQII